MQNHYKMQSHYEMECLLDFPPFNTGVSVMLHGLCVTCLTAGLSLGDGNLRWVANLCMFGVMAASCLIECYMLLHSRGICSAVSLGTVFFAVALTNPAWSAPNLAPAPAPVSSGSSAGGVDVFPIGLPNLVPSFKFVWTVWAGVLLAAVELLLANLPTRTPRARART